MSLEPTKHETSSLLASLGAGSTRAAGTDRWQLWRPTVAICQHEDLLIDRFELLFEPKLEGLAAATAADIRLRLA